MSLTSSLRWSLYDRVLALGPFLLGLLIAAVGIYVGAGAFLDELAFGDPSDAGSPSSSAIAVLGIVLGLLVWQVGRSAVRHHAMQVAIENRIGELVDEERIASEAATKVDDRIADVETDVEQVSRKTTRLEQEMRGDELGNDAFDTGPGSTATGGAEPADAAAAGTASGVGASTPADGAETDDATNAGAGESTPGATATGETETADADAPGSTADDATADEQPAAADDDTTASDADAETDEADSAAGSDDGQDGATEDGFEWEDDGDDGEYYRNN